MNGTNQIIADTSDNDHRRDGPKWQYWHVSLLLICPQRAKASRLLLVPGLRGERLPADALSELNQQLESPTLELASRC